MSKSFVLTHRYRPEILLTFGVDSLFLDILDFLFVDLSELSQKEIEVFHGTLAVLHPEISIKRAPMSEYVMRYL